jgi:small conductance mechanosensitive channel
MMEWDPIKDWLVEHGTRIGVILVVGFTLWFALRKLLPPAVRVTLGQSMSEESEGEVLKTATTLASTFMWVVRILIVMMVTFMILDELEVPIGPVLAGFGIAGIAVGFGAQYLIRDLIAGIFVVLENQYRVGDVVRLADVAGLVEEINLRKTVLRDLDGIVHHIPNGEIRVASNFTRKFSRVNLNISVAYATNLDQAIDIVNRVGRELAEDEEWREVILTPPQVLRVDNLGDSGIEIKVLGDVKPIQQWAVMGELRLRLKRVFDEEGIEIPWPHTKVYFGEDLRLSTEERFAYRAESTGPGGAGPSR